MTEFILAALFFVAGAAFIVARLARSHANFMGIAIAGLVVRIGLALADRFLFALPQSSSDAKVFVMMARMYSRSGCGNFFAHFDPSRSYVYSSFLAEVFGCVGYTPFGAQVINAVFGVLACLALGRSAELIWGRAIGTRVCLYLMFFPTMILYSSVALRESSIILLFSLGLLQAVKAIQFGQSRRFIFASMYFGFAGLFHGGMYLAIAAVFASYMLLRLKTDRANSWSMRTARIALAGLALVPAAYYAADINLNKLGQVSELSIDELAAVLSNRGEGGAAYLTGLSVSNVFDVIWQMPIRAFYFILSPMPWDISKLSHLFGLLDAVPYAILLYLVWKGRKVVFREPAVAMIALVCSALLLGFSFGTSNFGTAMRHRTKFMPALFIVAAPMLTRRRRGAGAPGDHFPHPGNEVHA